jgi:hypothetical protein
MPIVHASLFNDLFLGQQNALMFSEGFAHEQ